MADDMSMLMFCRQIFVLKCMVLTWHIFMKRRSLARKRRLERNRASARNRIATYLKFRSRQARSVVENFALQISRQRPDVTRSTWCKPRSENWWDNIVEETFTEDDWTKNFRMGRRTFDFLCEELHPFLCRENTNMRKAISVRRRVAISLWRLATNADYRTVGHLFGVSQASVCDIINEFCTVVSDVLLQKFIKVPVGEELDNNIKKFKDKWGFPQCVGAIDGSHIPIKAPTEFHADYYNRKGWYSIILQAVVDSSYKFIDINVGWPGKVHDARVFSNSKIFAKGMEGTLFPENKAIMINGVRVPLCIIADAAYPLLSWVMKPFPDNGKLSAEKSHFNYRLSRARMVVENAFGRLKGRWRCLLKQNEAVIERMNSVVATCCVLHNICEMFSEEFDPELLKETEDCIQPNVQGEANASNNAAKNSENIRKAFILYCQETDLR